MEIIKSLKVGTKVYISKREIIIGNIKISD